VPADEEVRQLLSAEREGPAGSKVTREAFKVDGRDSVIDLIKQSKVEINGPRRRVG
jgi:hypothetical protein